MKHAHSLVAIYFHKLEKGWLLGPSFIKSWQEVRDCENASNDLILSLYTTLQWNVISSLGTYEPSPLG